MNKEQFLAMSLPYGLKIITSKSLKYPIITYDCGAFSFEFERNGLNHYPVLHPLHDLTKPITHKGEAFVPMIELAKMCNVNLKTTDPFDVYVSNPDIIAFSGEHNLRYNKIGISFSYIIMGYRKQHIQTVFNQMELILKLIEWHFDIAGLIEKGEAVDINTLETNPYA